MDSPTTRSTPGVHLFESQNRAPGAAISGVPTAVAGFIGYTAQAIVKGNSVLLQPVTVNSLADFTGTFGGPPGAGEAVFTLARSVELFFENGGGLCTVVSAGNYTSAVAASSLLAGLQALAAVKVTMVAVPDAVLLPTGPDFASVAQAMLLQCATLQDRIALLDVYGAQTLTATSSDADRAAILSAFQGYVGASGLEYGAAYFPFLLTPEVPGQALPPSGAVAGAYARNDANRGVWKAPANVPLAAVLGASLPINEQEQAAMNQPVSGKAVNALRVFPGQGTLLWGARTLEVNDSSWLYVPVRRLMIFIEQSLKEALAAYVFEPNTTQTWAQVTDLINGFLMSLWQQGALLGATAAEAFHVKCGLGTTMTADDILNGIMKVELGAAVLLPAEFIVVTLQQAMAAG